MRVIKEAWRSYWNGVTALYAWVALAILLPFNALAWRFVFNVNRIQLEIMGEPLRSLWGVRGDYYMALVVACGTFVSVWYVAKCFAQARRNRQADLEPPRPPPRPPRPKPNRPKRRRIRR